MRDAIRMDRMNRRLDELSEISETEAGVTRLAYTELESEAIEYLKTEAQADCSIWTDHMGNCFVDYGLAPEADSRLLIGSHVDSVVRGGPLDGALGVVTAMECLDVLNDRVGPLAVEPTLVALRGEESARFGVGTIGSRGLLGHLTETDLSATDETGVTLRNAIEAAGFEGPATAGTLDHVDGMFEVHIEQGPILAGSGNRVGIVESIYAPVRLSVTVTGEYDHSGTTPMDSRHDALAAAAEMILAVESIGKKLTDEFDIVTTVGNAEVIDGAANKICGEVSFPIDVRGSDQKDRETVVQRIRSRCEEISEARAVSLNVEEGYRQPPQQLDPDIRARLEQVVTHLNVPYRTMVSGGGHDARQFQRSGVPSGMLFTPSPGGRSHIPEEETNDRSVVDAVAILVETIHDWDK